MRISKKELVELFNERMSDFSDDTEFDGYLLWFCIRPATTELYDVSECLAFFTFSMERLKHELFTDLKVENTRRLEIMMEDGEDEEDEDLL